MAIPTITNLSPSSGTANGGTSVAITGTNFVNGARVFFGDGSPAASVVFNSSTSLTATTRAYVPSFVNVFVVNPNGQTSRTVAASQYHFLDPVLLFVDGTNLATVVTAVQVIDGLYAAASSRGDDLTIPGLDGELWTDKPYGSGSIDIGLVLAAPSTTLFNDQYRTLKRLIRPGKKLQLTRQLTYSTGTESHVADATYTSGLGPTVSLMKFGKTTLSLKILSGLWYNPNTFSFSFTNAGTTFNETHGETRTNKISMIMAPNSTVTNVTTGHTVSLLIDDVFLDPDTGYPSGIDGTSPVTVDVINMTATQGSADVSAALSWNLKYPMQLDPGNNVFTYDTAASTVSVTYYPAYL